jgi:hypothetical protein
MYCAVVAGRAAGAEGLLMFEERDALLTIARGVLLLKEGIKITFQHK